MSAIVTKTSGVPLYSFKSVVLSLAIVPRENGMNSKYLGLSVTIYTERELGWICVEYLILWIYKRNR